MVPTIIFHETLPQIYFLLGVLKHTLVNLSGHAGRRQADLKLVGDEYVRNERKIEFTTSS